jgi:hypothetical protein
MSIVSAYNILFDSSSIAEDSRALVPDGVWHQLIIGSATDASHSPGAARFENVDPRFDPDL